MAYPAAGGPAMRLCDRCQVEWAPDGKFLYLALQTWDANGTAQRQDNMPHQTYAVSLNDGNTFARLSRSRLQLRNAAGSPSWRACNRPTVCVTGT
jgi:hypothetical protein